MKIIRGFKVCRFILAAAFSAGLGFATSASAQEKEIGPVDPAKPIDPDGHSYLVDLNSKTVTELRTSGGTVKETSGINDAGQVVGFFNTAGDANHSASHAFITGPNGMGMRDLGTLFGTGSNPDYSSTASGINGTGQVAGIATAPGGRFHAFITGPDGMGMRDLGTLGGAGNYFGGNGDINYYDNSYAYGINDAGQVVGMSDAVGHTAQHSFITGPNGMGMRDLGDLGGYGYSSANDINVVGQVVGGYFTAGDAVHAFITGPDGMGMRDPGTLGGASSWAYGINDAGQVVGQSLTAGGALHAFITGPDGTGMRDLGEGIATDINAAGQVVGYSGAGGGGLHAFITGSDGAGMMDLNSLVNLPRWMVLEQATAINNAGQVLVIGTIPEPESYAFFLAGLALIGFMARRKKVSARPLAWGSPVG